MASCLCTRATAPSSIERLPRWGLKRVAECSKPVRVIGEESIASSDLNPEAEIDLVR
jgi:hypothetical protein